MQLLCIKRAEFCTTNVWFISFYAVPLHKTRRKSRFQLITCYVKIQITCGPIMSYPKDTNQLQLKGSKSSSNDRTDNILIHQQIVPPW